MPPSSSSAEAGRGTGGWGFLEGERRAGGGFRPKAELQRVFQHIAQPVAVREIHDARSGRLGEHSARYRTEQRDEPGIAGRTRRGGRGRREVQCGIHAILADARGPAAGSQHSPVKRSDRFAVSPTRLIKAEYL